MNAIDVAGLSKAFGPTQILDALDFVLGETDRVGVVGRNGCGKSTLFRILAGQEEADAGRVVRRRNLVVGYLPQQPQLDPDATVRQSLEAQLGVAREKLARHQSVGTELHAARDEDLERLLQEQQELHSWLDHHDAWHLGHRVEAMCSRFSIPDPDARVGSLSGGWNQRVALAGLLLGQPDVLLLDEPTNQLDADTIAWLEEHLRSYPGAVLLVTHDRYFLDRVVTRMLELDAGQLSEYRGGYSEYLVQKAERLAAAERGQTRLLNLLRREEAWLARGPKARTTKQKARIDRVEGLREQRTQNRSREMNIAFEASKPLGGTVLEARGLGLRIADKTLVTGLDFQLRKGERVGVLGPNGCGKTTLIRALLGEVTPSSGSVVLGRNTRVGYLDQARSGLDPALSVAQSLGEDDWVQVGGPQGDRRHKVGYLEDFLFSREDQRKPVAILSGGERARLLLARLLLQGANVLVLDEPTNDLDIPTLQLLDEALAGFAGCVLLVTHDRYFLDRVATGILHFEGQGRVVFYEGNYEIFTRLRSRQLQEEQAAHRSLATATKSRREEQPARTRKTGLSYREREELAAVEEQVAELEEQQSVAEALLSDPSRLEGGHDELQRLADEHAQLNQRLEELLLRWEVLEGKKSGGDPV